MRMGCTDDVRIAVEEALPQSVAQDDDGLEAGFGAFLGKKLPTEDRFDAKHGKEARRDRGANDASGVVGGRHREIA